MVIRIFFLQEFNMVVIKQKITKCEITKTEFGSEMEIFITLTKYNTRREDGVKMVNHC